ncbi:MAG: hypothetical protein HQ527_10820 [Cyanobacteria bacterium]|nr:hypothetical protein [Cyanobacteria bacterium bin.51]
MPQLSASPNLISFLQAMPERRKRRGVLYPQWLLLLMAILHIDYFAEGLRLQWL